MKHNFIVNHKIIGPDAEIDNFQKRYVYNNLKKLIRVEYLNIEGKIYHIEKT